MVSRLVVSFPDPAPKRGEGSGDWRANPWLCIVSKFKTAPHDSAFLGIKAFGRQITTEIYFENDPTQTVAGPAANSYHKPLPPPVGKETNTSMCSER